MAGGGSLLQLDSLVEGDRILVGGDRYCRVTKALAEDFRPGDSLLVVQQSGEILHLPQADKQVSYDAVTRAKAAFDRMGAITDEQISAFFTDFARRLEDDALWAKVIEANDKDVTDAKSRGRSTTRLVATEKLRKGMIDGLRGWVSAASRRGSVLQTVEHEGWSVDLVGAALGVVGFVFEGRPNVLADATGVLRGGNTVVFRIGSDALGTARTMMAVALEPALAKAGLPDGAVCLIDSAARASGWALMSDSRLALGVARGSGPAVATLGSLAKQAGVPASLHGRGGAWLYISSKADIARVAAVVEASLDRKVCNTLNVCCIEKKSVNEILPAVLAGADKAAKKDGKQPADSFRLHVIEGDEGFLPTSYKEQKVIVHRADGDHEDLQVTSLPEEELGHEWEWEGTPEFSLKIVEDCDHAARLFNQYSPQFVASCVTEDQEEQTKFYELVNAPFIGNGFTRWVDGQYALNQPELGLSNWEAGRLFGRGGILSGDSVFTVRAKVTQTNASLRR